VSVEGQSQLLYTVNKVFTVRYSNHECLCGADRHRITRVKGFDSRGFIILRIIREYIFRCFGGVDGFSIGFPVVEFHIVDIGDTRMCQCSTTGTTYISDTLGNNPRISLSEFKLTPSD
jgi:hypothetical protein